MGDAIERIEVRVPMYTAVRKVNELVAFAEYCVSRLERDLGERDRWTVHVLPIANGYESRIASFERGTKSEARGYGLDGPLAIWDAICRLEQRLRERGRRKSDEMPTVN